MQSPAGVCGVVLFVFPALRRTHRRSTGGTPGILAHRGNVWPGRAADMARAAARRRAGKMKLGAAAGLEPAPSARFRIGDWSPRPRAVYRQCDTPQQEAALSLSYTAHIVQGSDGRARKRNRRNSLIRLYSRRSSGGNARHGPEKRKNVVPALGRTPGRGECPGGNVRQRKLKGNVNPAQEEAAGRHLKPPVRAPEQIISQPLQLRSPTSCMRRGSPRSSRRSR